MIPAHVVEDVADPGPLNGTTEVIAEVLGDDMTEVAFLALVFFASRYDVRALAELLDREEPLEAIDAGWR
jgi:hypothetical protein